MHESKFFCRFIMSLSRKSEAFIRFETRKTSKASIISQISNFLNDNSRISENRSTNIFSIIPAAFAIHSRLFFSFFFATLNTRRYFCPPLWHLISAAIGRGSIFRAFFSFHSFIKSSNCEQAEREFSSHYSETYTKCLLFFQEARK